MTRVRANSRRATNRPIAATPAALQPLDASLHSIVGNLEGLDLDGVRRQWRAHLGGEPPSHLPRWLLMKVLAYRLQSEAFSDLDNRSEGSFALQQRMASALLSTAARLKRERASA